MNRDQITEAYNICIDICGAPVLEKNYMNYLIEYFMNDNSNSMEWRFQGKLGFGGKLYLNYKGFSVDCYQENYNDARRLMIQKANIMLGEIK